MKTESAAPETNEKLSQYHEQIFEFQTFPPRFHYWIIYFNASKWEASLSTSYMELRPQMVPYCTLGNTFVWVTVSSN